MDYKKDRRLKQGGEAVLFDSAALNGGGGAADIEALEKINRVLMNRVEQTVDPQGSPYSLFQTGILLEDVVNERTDRLQRTLQQSERSNRELRVAKETAEEADLSKTRFLAAATHDLLQTPQCRPFVALNTGR